MALLAWYYTSFPWLHENTKQSCGARLVPEGNAHLAGVDHFFQGASCNEAIHGHIAPLPYAECPVLRLQVVAGVPAGIHYDHSVWQRK